MLDWGENTEETRPLWRNTILEWSAWVIFIIIFCCKRGWRDFKTHRTREWFQMFHLWGIGGTKSSRVGVCTCPSLRRYLRVSNRRILVATSSRPPLTCWGVAVIGVLKGFLHTDGWMAACVNLGGRVQHWELRLAFLPRQTPSAGNWPHMSNRQTTP